MKENRLYHIIYERNGKSSQHTVDHAALTESFDTLLQHVDWITIDLITKGEHNV